MGGNGQPSAGKIDVRLLDPTGGQMDKPPVFPGHYGLPFKGPESLIKQSDPWYAQPQVAVKVHVDILDLSEEDQIGRYREICQMVGNGYAQLSKEDLRYDEKKKHWRVFVRWLELFTYDPARGNSIRPRAGR